MRYITFFVFFIAWLNGFGQSASEAKRILNQRAHNLDSNYIDFITQNRWQLVYRQEKGAFKNKLTEIENLNFMVFDKDNVHYIFPKKPKSNYSGDYDIVDYWLIIQFSEVEISYFNILNIYDGKYLVLQVGRSKGLIDGIFRKPRVRLLFRIESIE
jgi:hypothetical protein